MSDVDGKPGPAAEDLQLLVKPVSADCNQTCAYCFYRRTAAMYPSSCPRRMSGETLEAMVRRYLRLRLPQSVFCWQGGEPTLAGLDFYRHAVALMQRFGASGQSVANAFQTNALLLDADWCRFFNEYRFLVGVSLDGPAEIHNAYRRTGAGGDTHAGVLRAIRLLNENAVEFNVLAVVSDRSAARARSIYTHFRELGITHMQFIPCIEADLPGLPAPFSVQPEAYAEFLCELFDLWLPEARAGVSVRLFDALLQHEITGSSGLCDLGGRCAGYLVVEHNGDAYPCDFFVQREWLLGNVRVTPVEALLKRRPARALRRARFQRPDACAACEWWPLCGGGCLKDRARLAGRFDLPTPFCRTYRRFLPYVMERIRQLAGEMRGAQRSPQ